MKTNPTHLTTHIIKILSTTQIYMTRNGTHSPIIILCDVGKLCFFYALFKVALINAWAISCEIATITLQEYISKIAAFLLNPVFE